MNTRTHVDPPSLPLMRRASTLIAMGTVGLALVAAGPANAEDTKPAKKQTTTTTTTTTTPELVRDDWYQSSRLDQRPLIRTRTPLSLPQ
jgi:hypothetical protein